MYLQSLWIFHHKFNTLVNYEWTFCMSSPPNGTHGADGSTWDGYIKVLSCIGKHPPPSQCHHWALSFCTLISPSSSWILGLCLLLNKFSKLSKNYWNLKLKIPVVCQDCTRIQCTGWCKYDSWWVWCRLRKLGERVARSARSCSQPCWRTWIVNRANHILSCTS